MLDRRIYSEFCIPYRKRIVDSIDEVPVILFSKGAHFSLSDIIDCNADVVGLDWSVEASRFRSDYGHSMVVQGNLDPCTLYAPVERIEQNTRQMIADFGNKHICNLGHGVYPDTPLEGVRAFINTIKNYKY